jgi:hypothetical protein
MAKHMAMSDVLKLVLFLVSFYDLFVCLFDYLFIFGSTGV